MSSLRLVSVIIPNYNHAPFLKERIDSVLNQTYDNFEVIILDDKSTDNSKEVIEVYRSHPRISQIVYNEENSGSTFKQWQKGFSLAKGEYIWIAESDDIAHPDFLKNLINAIAGDKGVVLAATGITLINEDGKTLGYESISKSKYIRKYSSKQFIRENMLIGNHLLNASSAIFRKDIISKIPKDYTKLKASGDYLFWVEIANQGKTVEIPDKLDYFRRSSTTVTPRLYASGKAFEESKIVFSRLQELGYAKGLYRNLIVGFRMNQIKKSRGFSSEEVRQHCFNLWKQENKLPLFDYSVLFLFGIYRKVKRYLRNL